MVDEFRLPAFKRHVPRVVIFHVGRQLVDLPLNQLRRRIDLFEHRRQRSFNEAALHRVARRAARARHSLLRQNGSPALVERVVRVEFARLADVLFPFGAFLASLLSVAPSLHRRLAADGDIAVRQSLFRVGVVGFLRRFHQRALRSQLPDDLSGLQRLTGICALLVIGLRDHIGRRHQPFVLRQDAGHRRRRVVVCRPSVPRQQIVHHSVNAARVDIVVHSLHLLPVGHGLVLVSAKEFFHAVGQRVELLRRLVAELSRGDGIFHVVWHIIGIDAGAILCYTGVRKRCSLTIVWGALTSGGLLHLFFCHSDKIIEQH